MFALKIRNLINGLRRIFVVFFVFFLISPVLAASDDLEKGFAAAQKERWGKAVEHFGRAFEENPYNPIVQFNYGLAQSKAGNELVAIALLNAYLAAVPQAANRSQVEVLNEQLYAQADRKNRRLFEVAIEAAEILPPGAFDETNIYTRRWDQLRILGSAQFTSGFSQGAQETFRKAIAILKNANQWSEEVDEYKIPFALEDMEKALRIFPDRYLLKNLGELQARAYDFEAAEKTRTEILALGKNADDVLVALILNRIILKIDERDYEGALELFRNPETLYGPAPGGSSGFSKDNYEYQKPVEKLFRVFIQDGDLQKAKKTIGSYHSNFPVYYNILAIEWLRMKNLPKAWNLASQAETYAANDRYCLKTISAAILGQASRSLEMGKRIMVNGFDPNSHVRCIAYATRALAYLGDFKAASAAFKLLYEREIPYKGKRFVSPWAKIYLDMAAGKLKKAQRKIERLEFESHKEMVREDLIYFALVQGEPVLAERYARTYNRFDILSRIAQFYEAEGSLVAANRLWGEIKVREEKRRAGWEPDDAMHEKKVEIWLDYTDRLLNAEFWEGYDDSVRDMDAFLNHVKSLKPHMMLFNLSFAGKIWAREIMRLRAMERRYASEIN